MSVSPNDRPALVLIGGCPRSGTTALQLFLGGHPFIATTRETHIFDYYVAPLLRRYQKEAEWMRCADGVRSLVSEDEVRLWCQMFASALYNKILAHKPGSAIVLEKTPDNTEFAVEIASLFPEACFISIVRDPRGVAASFLAAAREPWGTWAPCNAKEAAKRWLRAIKTLPQAEAAFGTRHFLIKYEDLLDPKADARESVVAFLSSQFPAQSFDLSQFTLPKVGATVDLGLSDDLTNPAKDERRNFFRNGLADGWRQELTSKDIATIERICGKEMRKFGYILG